MIELLIALIIFVLVIFLILLISALPLFFTVQLLGGKASIGKIIIANVYAAIIMIILNLILTIIGIPYVGLISILVLIYLYHEYLKLKWWKAAVAFFLQFIIAAILYYLAVLLGLIAFISTLGAFSLL